METLKAGFRGLLEARGDGIGGFFSAGSQGISPSVMEFPYTLSIAIIVFGLDGIAKVL